MACLILSTDASGCSPMNFSVTCKDSGCIQRASGAKLRTPSTKRAMRSRMIVVDVESEEEAHKNAVSYES